MRIFLGGSIVAQLGMLGWSPYLYSDHGRAIWELLALKDVQLDPTDLVFRANLVTMAERRLVDAPEGRRTARFMAGRRLRRGHSALQIEICHHHDRLDYARGGSSLAQRSVRSGVQAAGVLWEGEASFFGGARTV